MNDWITDEGLIALVQEYGLLRLVPIPANKPGNETARMKLADQYANEVVAHAEKLKLLPPGIYDVRSR